MLNGILPTLSALFCMGLGSLAYLRLHETRGRYERVAVVRAAGRAYRR
jgi:hypothetical protein